MKCWKPETSSHSSANFVFGSVMSELLDSFPAGIPPPHLPTTCQLPYRCCRIRWGLSPSEYHGSPVSVSAMSACHLHVAQPIPQPYRFILPFPFSFPLRVFKMGQACRQLTSSGWPLTRSETQLLSPWLCSILRFFQPPFVFRLYLIAHPAASLLWGHSLRQQQSWWKALPYLPSHAKSDLWDSGNRWSR